MYVLQKSVRELDLILVLRNYIRDEGQPVLSGNISNKKVDGFNETL